MRPREVLLVALAAALASSALAQQSHIDSVTPAAPEHNRSFDQLFVLNEMDRLAGPDPGAS
jgi:hypothetical protein